MELSKRVREGIVAAGGICFEVPVHPIQETGKRPTAMLIATLLICRWSKRFMAIPSMGSC